MYKLHLILKYLRKRRIAWVSLIAVMLCTAMVLVVISVMGGWLRMFEENFHGLTGDVVISAKTLRGFGYYERMIAEVEKLPEVAAAVPVIQTYGLINIGKRRPKASRSRLPHGADRQGQPISPVALLPVSTLRRGGQASGHVSGEEAGTASRGRGDGLGQLRLPPLPKSEYDGAGNPAVRNGRA